MPPSKLIVNTNISPKVLFLLGGVIIKGGRLLNSSRKPSGYSFSGFRRRHHPTFVMVSFVGSFYGFRRGRKRLFMVSVVVFLLWFPSRHWRILPPQEDP